MATQEIELMAHLMRRAGFSATRGEIESYASNGYESTVEALLHPNEPSNMPQDIIRRVHMQLDEGAGGSAIDWAYRMITTTNPLEEKITLFWHSLFAVGYAKGNQSRSQMNQIDTFRRNSLGSFRNLLIELSRDPAMIFWLDNNENVNGAVNENYGRELLELFSMGVGNYTEQDVKECARSFTGWTIGNEPYMRIKATKDSFSPFGRIGWHPEYLPDHHDGGVKTFLGEMGRFNGEDIIDIIVRQPATANFICGRIFQFFAADQIDDDGANVIRDMTVSYFESGHEIRSVLRTLFNSEFFKSPSARFARVKSPVEVMIGAIRMAGSCQSPKNSDYARLDAANFMGQGLLRPPSVEGWHEGVEWIDSGAVVERSNFAAQEMSDVSQPGIQGIIRRLSAHNGGTLTPQEAVDYCLDLVGPMTVSGVTRNSLIKHLTRRGDLDLGDNPGKEESEGRVGELLGLIASTPEFQFA